MLNVKQLRHDNWFTYIVSDRTSGEAVVVDPVRGLCDLIELFAEEDGLNITAIVETQSHWQRLSGHRQVKEDCQAAIMMAEGAGHAYVDQPLKDGDAISIGGGHLRVHAAPGVSGDALVLSGPGFAFTGNTLLIGGSGALGLPGSSSEALHHTLVGIFPDLDESTILYPAQDCSGRLFSTLLHERQHNHELVARDRSTFATIKAATPLLRPSQDLQRIWDANHGPTDDLSPGLTKPLPCSCLSRDTYVAPGARPACGEIDALTAHERRQAGAQLLDVRESFELLVGEVPGAQHLPVSELGERMTEVLGDDVMVLCAHGNRSAWAVNTLNRLGRTSTSVMGGLSAWRDAGLEVA